MLSADENVKLAFLSNFVNRLPTLARHVAEHLWQTFTNYIIVVFHTEKMTNPAKNDVQQLIVLVNNASLNFKKLRTYIW